MPGVEPVRAAILDASVAVRWIAPEAGTEHAVELLSQPITWIAPRLMVAEVAAALRRKVVGDDLPAEHAIAALGALLAAVADGTIQLAEDETLVGGAITLALTSGRPVPDCLYLAIAEREGAALATADRWVGGRCTIHHPDRCGCMHEETGPWHERTSSSMTDSWRRR